MGYGNSNYMELEVRALEKVQKNALIEPLEKVVRDIIDKVAYEKQPYNIATNDKENK